MTTREHAAVGSRNMRRAASPTTRPAGLAERELRMMELADGRVHVVDAKTKALFAPCASRAVAERMLAVFSR